MVVDAQSASLIVGALMTIAMVALVASRTIGRARQRRYPPGHPGRRRASNAEWALMILCISCIILAIHAGSHWMA